MNIETYIEQQLITSSELYAKLGREFNAQISEVCRAAVATLRLGRKILLCGNGGSASDAEHIAAEFVGRFRRDRLPLPAIALTSNGADLTAIGNDFGFEHVFARQVYALGRPGDLLICFTTSGNSKNVIEAVEAANEIGMTTVGLTGGKGTRFAEMCDIGIAIPSPMTALVQECHMSICHLMCEAVDEAILGEGASIASEAERKIVSLSDLVKLRSRWSATRRTVVWASGCFDLLHIGHVRTLREARAQGDVLVVGIDSDESVRATRGPDGPLIPELDRAEVVAALDCVTAVVVIGDPTPERVLAALGPDVACPSVDSDAPSSEGRELNQGLLESIGRTRNLASAARARL